MFSPENSYQSNVSSFISKVYLWMTSGLLLSSLVSFFLITHPAIFYAIFSHKAAFICIMFAQLGLVFLLSRFLQKMSFPVAVGCFFLYAMSVGITLTPLFIVYSPSSIGLAFGITASMFTIMAAYGYFTKADLSGVGNIMLMGLFGIIIASLINLFIQSPMMNYIISYVSVVIFTALTAYDVQMLKHLAQASEGDVQAQRHLAIFGALGLYLNFINLFISVLQILGDRRK